MSLQTLPRPTPLLTARTDGTLVYEVPVHNDAATVHAFFDAMAQAAAKTPRRLLADARSMVGIDSAARGALYARVNEVEDVRIAVVTANRLQRAVVSFLVLATRHRNVHTAMSIEEAEAWLSA